VRSGQPPRDAPWREESTCAGSANGAPGGRARRDVAGACEGGDSEDSVSLLSELNAFFTEHGRCGDLEGGVDGPVVWFDCECGASIVRRVDEDDRVAVE
jgi:hypothetical protein